MIVPAQAVEERNHPHAGRHATFLRENARTFNEPVAKVSTKTAAADARWWEWNTVSSEAAAPGGRRSGKRSQSNAPPSSAPDPAAAAAYTNANGGFQTTYQKDHGYLKELLMPNGSRQSESAAAAAATRHGSNPNARQAVGIVPVNDLTTFSKSGEEQRVFVDKMSFEHQYDSRKDNNYPVMGKVS